MAKKPVFNLDGLCKKDLKSRGWTETMITRLLPRPDGFRYSRGGMYRQHVAVWSVSVVKRVEDGDDFQRWSAQLRTQRGKSSGGRLEPIQSVDRDRCAGFVILLQYHSKSEASLEIYKDDTFHSCGAYVLMNSRGFATLAKECIAKKNLDPALDWLAKNDAGKERFKDALPFVINRDGQGWEKRCRERSNESFLRSHYGQSRSGGVPESS